MNSRLRNKHFARMPMLKYEFTVLDEPLGRHARCSSVIALLAAIECNSQR